MGTSLMALPGWQLNLRTHISSKAALSVMVLYTSVALTVPPFVFVSNQSPKPGIMQHNTG
jgi:hypothetical protein